MSGIVQRRIRRAARVVLMDMRGRVLLFRYVTADLDPFWILPGGECDPQEDFPQAAARELREETGIAAHPRPLGIVRQAEYDYLGEPVKAIEHFFVHRTAQARIDTAGHTELERRVMLEHRWFETIEMTNWAETIYPLDLRQMVERIAAS